MPIRCPRPTVFRPSMARIPTESGRSMTVRSSGLIGLLVDRVLLLGEDIPFAVERHADAGDDPAEQLLADRHHERRPGGDDIGAGHDPLHVADRHEDDPVAG